MDDADPLMHVDWQRWLQRLADRVNELSTGISAFSISGGQPLTKTDDTNVTLTLGGTPATALLKAVTLTPGWSGTLALSRGGTAAALTAVNGGLVYSGAAALAITAAGTSGQIVKSAGAAAPTWNTPGALTKTDDANVTLTLGGSPTTALVNAASLTLGWTGTLAVTRGGIGVGTLASNGVLYGNGTSAIQALAVNSSATQKFLSQVSSGAPTWEEVAASSGTVRGEVPSGAVNGVNTVYTTAAEYTGLAVYRNGVRQKLTTDYTETTPTTFTFVVAPLTGDLLQVDYSESGGGGGSGALVLLEELIASTSTSLDVLTAISATYDEYHIEFVSLQPTTDGSSCKLTVSTDGGSTWKTTGYEYAVDYRSPSGASGVVNSTTDTSLFMLNLVRNTTDGMSGWLKLFNPGGALSKLFLGSVAGLENDGNRYWFDGSWWYVSATAINALRVAFPGDTIASGVVRVYGVAKL